VTNLLGVRRPVGALVGCDLSQPPFVKPVVEFGVNGGVKPPPTKSADRSAHSKELSL
jgi:hypothetical protein